MRTERDAGFGLLRTEEARPGFDDGHLRPEPRERLPELDAHGAAAEDGERAGELTRQHRLTVGPEFHSVSPPTSTVCGSMSFPSPRTSLAPVASMAAAGRVSSRSRAIQ